MSKKDDEQGLLWRIEGGRLHRMDGSKVDWSEPLDPRVRSAFGREGKDRRDPTPDPGWARTDGAYRLIGPGLKADTPYRTAYLRRYLLVPDPPEEVSGLTPRD